MAEFRSPIGTRDVLAPESHRWEALVVAFGRAAERAGYGMILTPLFEDLAVFQRVGESTDVVRKEMYDFEDKGGRQMALRPEVTASVVRAFIQHRPTVPWKAWYVGPNFRYESPQAGRFRQFYQLGVEAIGSADADLDVEVIVLGWRFYADLGLRRVSLSLNSLGDDTCRPAYRQALLRYLDLRRSELCDEHKARLEDNPLRVLDCKKPECVAATEDAPRQLDHLCEPCSAHFERVKAGLESLGVPYRIDTRLVRGLDYYTRTTFEYAADALETAQNAIGGGGRYDGLVEEMGGPSTPAIGFALGVERILLACDVEGVLPATGAGPDVFVVDFAGGAAARDLTFALRDAGLRADRAFDNRSPKSQFKAADRSGARLALVVGPDEAAAGTVSIKDLRAGAGGGQDAVAVTDLVDEVRRRLSALSEP
ncbi:MAG TPA: histidine--tRNA ligase [Acidimicrobiales bacterium]